MGAPTTSERYDLTSQLPPQIVEELRRSDAHVLITSSENPVVVIVDLLWSNFKTPILSFTALCFIVGFLVVTRAIYAKLVHTYIKPK